MENQTIKKSKKELSIELEAVKKRISLMKQLVTKEKFYNYYFNLLSKSKTREQAFEKVNQLYFDLFGLYRFENFIEFNKATTNFI